MRSMDVEAPAARLASVRLFLLFAGRVAPSRDAPQGAGIPRAAGCPTP